MQQRINIIEAHPIDSLDETVLIPLPYVQQVQIEEKTVTLYVGGQQFLCSREDWNNATLQR